MLNKCCFIGNLGKDPELRTTQAGKRVASLSLGVSERWKDSSGERKERTEWVKVVIFNDGLCGVVEKYLHKGSKVYIEGQFQTRKWTDKEGQDKYSSEIVLQGFDSKLIMLDGKGDGGERSNTKSESNRDDSADLDSDSIPF